MTSVLFVRLSAMGDLVQGLGAIAALHEARPEWRLSLVTQSQLTPLVRGIGGIARVIPFERDAGLAGVRRLRRALREEDYDVALDLQGNWKSAFVAWLSRARRRIGMAPPLRQEPSSRLLLTAMLRTAEGPHPARAAMSLVRSLAPDAPFRMPRLTPSDAEIERERAALAELGIDWRAPFRVIVLTDPADPRALRPAVVEAETRDSTQPVVHLAGPDEERLPSAAAPLLRHGLEPRRLIALGAVVAQCGGVVLGPDRGATHVLAAAGARCIASFGAQDPRRTAPPAAVVLVHPQPPTCSPCRRRVCNHAQGPVCMEFGSQHGRTVDLGFPSEDRASR